MTAVIDLHQSEYLEFEYLLVVQGLPFAWWSGTDPGALGGSYLPHGVVIKPGLEVPRKIRVSGDFRDGMLERNRATFRIADLDDSLVALFRSDWADGDLTSLKESLRPDTDPAPATLLNEDNFAETIRGKNIGNEYIHTDGTRNARYITPSDVTPGPDHAIHFTIGGVPSLPRIYVSDDPYTFKGRRVALYRIVYDHHLAAWPTFQEQYDGQSLIWSGSMKDSGEMVGPREWSINCGGPRSWLSKPLNSARPTTVPAPESSVSLGSNEDGIAISATYNIEVQGTEDGFVEHIFVDADKLTGSSGPDLIAEVGALIQKIIDDEDGEGLGFREDDDQRDAQINADGSIGIEIEDDANDNRGGILEITMHIKAWLAIGWDPPAQGALELSDILYCESIPIDKELGGEGVVVTPGATGNEPPPGPGYWKIVFTTVYKNDWAGQYNADWANNGKMRTWAPLWNNGVVVLGPDSGQRIRFGQDQFWIEGQKAHPFNIGGGVKVGGQTADRSGWFMFKGQIQRIGDSEPQDYAQVAFMSWVDEDGAARREQEDDVVLVVERWENPRFFGLPYEKMTTPWALAASAPHEVIPLGLFPGYVGLAAPAEAHKVLGRILLSSGTATAWNGFIPPTAGTNAPSDDDGDRFMASDLEIQDLGLNIPASMVDFDSLFVEADSLEGGHTTPINRWQHPAVGPVESQDVIKWICQGRAWAISWRKGPTDKVHRFGLISPFRTLSPDEAEITITDVDLAGIIATPDSWWPTQGLRWEAPIDRFTVEAGFSPETGSSEYSLDVESKDKARASRDGFQEYEVKDHGLTNEDFWRSTELAGEFIWQPEFESRFQEGVAEWYEKRHFPLSVKLKGPKAHFAGVGTVVRYTDTTRPASPGGSYGLTSAMGRITDVDMILREGDAHARHAEVTMLMQADDTSRVRVWMGIARASDWDGATSELFCDGEWAGDWLEHGEEQSDVTPFIKKSWQSGAGDAEIKILQSEDGGATYGYEVTANVSAVNTTTHVMTLTSVVGKIYRDMDKIVLAQDYDSQGSTWLQDSFSVVTNPDGTFGGSATQGFKLK